MTIPTPRVRTRSIASTSSHTALVTALPTLTEARPRFICVAADQLKPASRRVRKHRKGALETAISNVERFRHTPPILVTEALEIVDGHLIFEVYQKLGFTEVPVQVISGLSEAEIKALRIAIHAIADLGEFDDPALCLDLKYLFEIDPLLVTYTALPMPKIDALLNPSSSGGGSDDDPEANAQRVAMIGDRFVAVDGSVIYNGDAKDPAAYINALAGRRARMGLSDPPYAFVPIKNVVSRRHSEFVEGSSMRPEEVVPFFRDFLTAMRPHLEDGAICDLFIDHRGMHALTTATQEVGLKHLCTCVWSKEAGGMGGLYRHQCEFVLVLKHGSKPHTNNVRLGKYGRNRTTLWSAPGFAQFGPGRKEALEDHPTVKPVALLMDAILDVTNPGDVVLDPFVGSGSTVVAAHRTKRIGVGIELDSKFVTVAIRRMERVTGQPMIHEATGLTFDELADRRAADPGFGASISTTA